MNTSKAVPCKAQYGKHIRRFRVPATVTYQQLVAHVRNLFRKEKLPEHFLLKYRDDEDDWVTFESNEELAEGLQVVQVSTTLFRLKIEKGKSQRQPTVPETQSDDVELLLNQLVSDTTQFVSNMNTLGKNTYYKVKEQINKLDKKETEQVLQQAVGSIKSTIKNVISDVQTTFHQTTSAPVLLTPPQQNHFVPIQPEEEWTLEIDSDSGFQIYEGAPKNLDSNTDVQTHQSTLQVPTENINAVVDTLINDMPKNTNPTETIEIEDNKGKLVVETTTDKVEKPTAKFVHDVNIPDGSKILPSVPLTKVWKLRNAGASAWPSDVSVVFVGGDEAFGKPLAIKVTPAEPKEEVDVELTLMGPATAGRYISFWRLACNNGQTQFGPKFWLEVLVSQSAMTQQPKYAYADQMELLNDMGFCDVELCTRLLDKFRGDVAQTVTEYLQVSNN